MVATREAHAPHTRPSETLRCIVILKPSVDKSKHLTWLNNKIKSDIKLEQKKNWDDKFLKGYIATVDKEGFLLLHNHEDVAIVEEEKFGKLDATVTQTDAPWGLSRVSQNAKLPNTPDKLDFSYKYDDKAGKDVNVYIIDSGIKITHTDFEGRAKWGTSVQAAWPNDDILGHGTHVAGTAGGKRWGVAKKVELYAVKVTNTGSISSADFIDGVKWVQTHASTSGRPSVTNMSLGFPASDAIDLVVTNLRNTGVHTVASAGNDNTQASGQSPGRIEKVVTVAASNILDERWASSNYGKAVDLFAPGEKITSCGITSNTATAVKNGTSMAAPHVSGMLAYLISVNGNKTPDLLKAELIQLTQVNVLTLTVADTANRLLRNNIA